MEECRTVGSSIVSGHRSWSSLKRYTHIRQTGDKYAGWRLVSTIAVSDRLVASDFTAIFVKVGWIIGSMQATLVRCLAAIATWALALLFYRRLLPNAAALAVMVLAMSYMCLFNPRAEGVTYAIIALPLASVISLGIYSSDKLRLVWFVQAAVLLLLGCNGIFRAISNLTNFWFKPALTICLLCLMGLTIVKSALGNTGILDPLESIENLHDASARPKTLESVF